MRIIRANGPETMRRWKDAGIFWGEPLQMGPNHWHVYGAHKIKSRKWLPLNAEFMPTKIVLIYPRGVRRGRIYSANAGRQGRREDEA